MARKSDPPTTSVRSPSAVSAVVPAQRIAGRVVALGASVERGRLGFVTEPLHSLLLDHEGILPSRHRGFLRRADARTPYLKRGTPIRNQRHVSLVAPDEVSEMAHRLALPAPISPHTLGANIVLADIPQLSWLPRGTKLFFERGLILIVEDQNAPCSLAGDAVMRAALANGHDDPDIRRRFPKVAQGLRGLIATVEHPGTVATNEAVVARLPEQWLYRGRHPTA